MEKSLEKEKEVVLEAKTNSADSSLFQGNYSSKLAHTSHSIPERMMAYLLERQSNLNTKNTSDYLTLEELSNLIRKDPNIPEYSKKRVALNYALKELFNKQSDSNFQIGAFLYPKISIEDKRITSKIYVMAPISKNDVNLFYKTCFESSLPAIHIILSSKYTSSSRLNDNNYFNSLINENRSLDKKYSPYDHCFEEEIRRLCRKAFNPYHPISLSQFIEDVVSYGMKSKSIYEISSDYHIYNYEVQTDMRGSVVHEPEIYYHFFSHLSSLQTSMLKDLYRISIDYGMNTFKEEIDLFSKKFPDPILHPEWELKRASLIIDIIEAFPSELILQEKEKKYVRQLRNSAKILKRIVYLLPGFLENRYQTLLNNSKLRLHQKISHTSSVLNRLQPISIENLIQEVLPTSVERKLIIEKEFRKIILEQYGSYEYLKDDGKKELLLLDPAYMGRILYNLAKLSIKNPDFRREYNIAKVIEKQLTYKNKPINFHINDSEIFEINSKLPGFDLEITKIEKREKSLGVLFKLYQLLIVSTGVGYLTYLKFFQGIETKYLSSPLGGFFIAYILHSFIKLKKKN